MKLALCTEYPGLDPITILDYPLADVFDLITEHVDRSRRTRQAQPQPNIKRPQPKTGTKVIHRPAGDDWF